MRSGAALLSSTLVCAWTVLASHQCIIDPGPSSLPATCSSRLSALVPFDRYEERQYAEIALHYLDGTKNVISTTGYYPHCAPGGLGRHTVSSLRAQDTQPYKATWTRIRYISSLSESPCAQAIISEKVNAISVESLPADSSGGTPSSHAVSEMGHSDRPGKQLGAAVTSDDVGYVPIKRRATFGELCQLLMLFMVLGALHYASTQFAARLLAPPPTERRSPQCE
ncbi:unnamed protein product [Rhizoctonia solani]|uniref:GOLD domain-containing protein n=1 Tax=Rhizoctonia solani TaxID=456999 RepID=A0A8H3GR37_9AGAM|nr:unnamed protein product [Rhizoctonia solani]